MLEILGIIIILFFLLLLIHFTYTLITIYSGACYVPSPKSSLEDVIQVKEFKESDVVLDLGSGDGRFLIAASKAGAGKCIGVELNFLLVLYSRLKVKLLGLKNIEIRNENFWKTDLSEVTVLILYLVPIKMDKLIDKVKKEMSPESEVIAFRYKLNDWKVEKESGEIYLFKVGNN